MCSNRNDCRIGTDTQNEVKAAWEKMTSLIGQILGISEDTGEYIKQIQNKIAKNGVTVSLEEVAVDDENLWIAYSMTDENGNNDVSMSSIEISVDGVKLELERQYSNYNEYRLQIKRLCSKIFSKGIFS